MVRELILIVHKRVDEGALRLDLSSPMQQVLEEVLEGVLDKVLNVVNLKEVLERLLVDTHREALEEVHTVIDLFLLFPLRGNREQEEEGELEKESAVKEGKKRRTYLFPSNYIVACEALHHYHVILFRPECVN